MSEDPRVHPMPGAEIEVLGAKKSIRRRVLRVYNESVDYESPQRSGMWLTYTSTLKAWRQWAFPGRVVSNGKP